MKKYDVVALGELLIDFTMSGQSEQGNDMFEVCPGGAPCNVLAMLNKLGRKTAFIGKVGNDQFGKLLKSTIEEIGIDTKGLLMDEEVRTTLAFVHTFPDGDRDFSFYKNPGADMMLSETEVDTDMIRDAKVFHLGTLSMTDEPVRTATKKALDAAKEAGCLISFDPNLRPPLWKSLDTAKEMMEYGFGYCDILKISDNEIQFVSGKEDYDEGIQVNTIETTGAGDSFCGSAISGVLDKGIDKLTEADLTEILTFANAAAAIVTTKKGAIRSMPEREEVLQLICG